MAGEPAQIRAGTTLAFTKSIFGTDSADWSLTYTLANASGVYSFAGTADGLGGWTVSVPPATTTGWSAGSYVWVAQISDGTDTFDADTGEIEVLPVLGAAGDFRSAAQIGLDAIEAVLANRATKDQEEMSIAGRSLRRSSIDDLLKLRNHYKALVRKEQGRSMSWGVRLP